jgi:NitT/TauT family transport system permease protein
MTDVVQRRLQNDRGLAPRTYHARGLARAIVSRLFPPFLFCAVVLLLWEIMARVTANPLIPNVSDIGGEIARILAGGLALQQIAITLGRIVLGFAAAFVIALVVGIPAARIVFLRRFFDPVIILGLTVPGLVWALLCVIWFGISLATPVVAIALGVAPALVLYVIQGVNAVDPEIVEMAHLFRLSRRDKLLHIWIPLLVPYLIGGSRVGLSLAWKVIVLVELFGLSNGVGYQLNSEFSSQNVAGVLAWTIVFWLVMNFIEYGVLQTLERYATSWRRTTRL